jgi:hypothetical protein
MRSPSKEGVLDMIPSVPPEFIPGVELPTLSRSPHRQVSEGASLMEYVSVLAGVRFNDHPCSTHPAPSALARVVNDPTSPTTAIGSD